MTLLRTVEEYFEMWQRGVENGNDTAHNLVYVEWAIKLNDNCSIMGLLKLTCMKTLWKPHVTPTGSCIQFSIGCHNPLYSSAESASYNLKTEEI